MWLTRPREALKLRASVDIAGRRVCRDESYGRLKVCTFLKPGTRSSYAPPQPQQYSTSLRRRQHGRESLIATALTIIHARTKKRLLLSIKAELENVTDLAPASDGFEYFFEVRFSLQIS